MPRMAGRVGSISGETAPTPRPSTPALGSKGSANATAWTPKSATSTLPRSPTIPSTPCYCPPRQSRKPPSLAFAGERRYKARLHADIEMPKLKTKSGAKKRFGRTASGKITMNVAHKRHRLISKPKQMKRKARGKVTLRPGDAKLVLTYMPYLRG